MKPRRHPGRPIRGLRSIDGNHAIRSGVLFYEPDPARTPTDATNGDEETL